MVGDIIKLNGQELLVLDYFNDNPFVICLNTGIETVFNAQKNTNYFNSILRSKMKEWARKTGLNNYAIPRDIDLTAMDGSKYYGCLKDEIVAPLTFDEYRKYNHIMKPHIKNWFWLATPWGDPNEDNWASDIVCRVGYDGSANSGCCYGSGGLAPAFILNKKFLVEDTKLSAYTTEELLQEIARRVN